MDIREAYNIWSSHYDTNENKTRDLEALVLRASLSKINFSNCLEIGCGTGKNTLWLAEKTKHITAVDFSDEMLTKAKEKIVSDIVEFKQADITKNWDFSLRLFDLITFSLVLEHIENLEHIFQQATKYLKSDGLIYIGELHPSKQYSGSKARFENEEGLQNVECFTHHVSDFIQAAKKSGFTILDINEYFDGDDKTSTPRILTIILAKQ